MPAQQVAIGEQVSGRGVCDHPSAVEHHASRAQLQGIGKVVSHHQHRPVQLQQHLSQFPASYQGKYFFADYLRQFIKVLDPPRSFILKVLP